MPVEVAPAVATATTTMEITISKFELLRELTATQGVVERKTTIPILSNYLFEAAGDKLQLTATDLDLSLRTAANAKVKKEGACTIPARKLYDYVKLLPDADITIKLLENHWVSIRCGRSNTKMVGMARSNFPALPVFPTAGVVKIPSAVLRSMIAKTGFAIAHEESRYTLNGALMVLKAESITMVATDGHRLAHIERSGEKFDGVSGEMKTLVPKKAMDELKSLLEAKQAADADNSTLKGQVGTLNSQVSDKNAKIADLEDQLAKMRSDLTTTKAELAQLKETPPAPSPMDFSKGVIFKVQIGAFKNKDLAKYFDNNPNFGGEATEKGEQRYTIGVFRDYWEADKFKKYMREMGVKDAWIVPFKDGARVEIKDVLEGVVADKAEKSGAQ